MSRGVRRAGTAMLADGVQVTWSVADGRRGRRWRAITRTRGTMDASLLLEVAPDGRPTRLELATAAGLLTLHPGADGLLHGNAVTDSGVRHLALPWSAEHELEVQPLAISSAVTADRLAATTATGEGRTVPVVVVGVDLTIGAAVRGYVREEGTAWRIDRDGVIERRLVDDRGLPVWPVRAEQPGGAEAWPLELERDAEELHRGQAVDNGRP